MKHSHEKKKMILKDTPSPSNIEQHIFFCKYHFSQRKRKTRLGLTIILEGSWSSADNGPFQTKVSVQFNLIEVRSKSVGY